MYPKVVALDTDWTIYSGTLKPRNWGKGRGAHSDIEDNIERVNDHTVRDCSNHKNKCRMFDDVPDIISDILKNGAKLAIVTRHGKKVMSDRALHYFKVKDAQGNSRRLISLVHYDEVYDKEKTNHFKKIKGWAGCSYTDMILFDDNPMNNIVEMEQGVTFQVCRDKEGLTWENYRHGIHMWRRNKAIESPWRGLDVMRYPKRKFLGYSGMDVDTIKLLEAGGRRHDREEAARWGYAMYVADNPAVAKYFAKWIKKTTPDFGKTIVCSIWARDGDIWDRLNKIWVPDKKKHQTWIGEDDESDIAWKQEDRDDMIEEWGVKKPYVLFSRHTNMKHSAGLKFPIANGRRFNEMVVYGQIQEALIVVERMTSDELELMTELEDHVHYERKLKAWNITVPDETYEDFEEHGEKFRK